MRAVRLGFPAFLLLLTSLVVTAPPAAAAKAPPWRFVTITGSVSVPAQADAPWIGQCPSGYTAVTGGFQAQAQGIIRSLEYPTHADGTYHLILHNGGGGAQTVSVTAYCAHRDDISLGYSASAVFNRNGSGRAGGTLSCPEGYAILTGGVDWATTGTAQIDWSAPTPLGDAWFVSGWSSGSGGQIGIEIFCMPDSLLTGYQVVTSTTTEAGSNGTKVATASCPLGKRLLSGGSYGKPLTAAFSAADTGYSWQSIPAFDTQFRWKASAFVTAGTALTAVALCIPASQPTASITGTSPDLTNDRQPNFTPVGTDQAGETVTTTCAVDAGQFYSCPNGAPTQFPTQVADGVHSLTVRAVNTSGQLGLASHNWTVDGTAPTVADFGGSSGVAPAGPITVTFSEAVLNATNSTVTVKSGPSTTIPGSVSTETSGGQTLAHWTPDSPLTPGQTYQVTVNAGITDLAGNALQPTFGNVQVLATVENTSPLVVTQWDPDTSSKASDGKYVASRSRGSSISRTFSATDGAKVSVWGIRRATGGYADIYLDGSKVARASFYAAATTRAAVYTSPALSAGPHTLKLVVLGTKPTSSTAAWVNIDNLKVGATTYQQTRLTQAFKRVTSASASGGSYDALTHTTGGDSANAGSYRLSFSGTGVRVFVTRTTTSGKAAIYIDGVRKTTVNLRSSSTVYKSQAYATTSLVDGLHTVVVRPLGSSDGSPGWVNLDYFAVLTAASG